MKNRQLLTTLLMAISLSIHAQTVIRSATLVLNNNDTLHGFINYKGWSQNPKQIVFHKDSLSRTTTTYSVDDVSYFDVHNLDIYQRVIVIKDARPVTQEDAWYSNMDSIVTDTVWLRVLVKGQQLSLYELSDEKDHYFISSEKDIYEELIYRFNKVEGNNNDYFRQETYKTQLLQLSAQFEIKGNIIRDINHTNYEADGLTKIVVKLNGEDPSHSRTVTTRQKTPLKWFIAAGGGYSKMKISNGGDMESLNHLNSQPRGVALIRGGFHFPISRNLQAVSAKVHLTLMLASYEASSTSISSKELISFTQESAGAGITFLYNFMRNDKIRVHADMGASIWCSGYSRNTFYANGIYSDGFLQVSNFWAGGHLGLGALWHNRYELAASIPFFPGSFSQTTNTSFFSRLYTLEFGYQF